MQDLLQTPGIAGSCKRLGLAAGRAYYVVFLYPNRVVEPPLPSSNHHMQPHLQAPE